MPKERSAPRIDSAKYNTALNVWGIGPKSQARMSSDAGEPDMVLKGENKKKALILLCLFGFSIATLIRYNNYTYNENFEYLKDGINIDNYTCDNFIYVCCKIYDTCTILEDNRLTSTYLDINPEYYVCHDEKCNNCPRLHEIILDYNIYMEKTIYNNHLIQCGNGIALGDFRLESNQHNHCNKINYACDTRYYYDIIIGNETTSYLYESQSNGDRKDDISYFVYPQENGSPTTIIDLWLAINNGYLMEDKSFIFFLKTILSFIGWSGLCCFLICLYNCQCLRRGQYIKTPTEDKRQSSEDKRQSSIEEP